MNKELLSELEKHVPVVCQKCEAIIRADERKVLTGGDKPGTGIACRSCLDRMDDVTPLIGCYLKAGEGCPIRKAGGL